MPLMTTDGNLLSDTDIKEAAQAASVEIKRQAKRIAELEARDSILRAAVGWFEKERPQWGPGTLPTWYVDATR